MKNTFLAGAIALAVGAIFGTSAIAQETVLLSTEGNSQITAQQTTQRDPRDPIFRRDDPTLLEEGGPEELEESLDSGAEVTYSIRLNTELFVNSGDLVELLLPIRYSPSDRLALEAVPVIKYFPESTEEEFDYGFKFAVEYRL